MLIPPLSIQAAVRERLQNRSDVHVSRELHTARQTLARIAAGLPVHRSTIVSVAVALGLDPAAVLAPAKE